MEQRERIQDFEEGLRSAILGMIKEVWTALPGIVQSVKANMTCTVQPTIKAQLVSPKNGQITWQTLPVLVDVPLVFLVGGGFAVTVPVKEGDEVLVVFAARCINAWWQNGGIQNQGDIQFHDMNDGFAIPGPRSLPNIIPSFSLNSARMTTLDGSSYLELAPGGVINIVAPGGVNINGAVAVTGTIGASGEITAKGTHTVSAHIHGGVQAGGANTAPPTG